MRLKCHTRKKDGKEHRYWSIVESVRCTRDRVVQRHVLYLGELNDSQRAEWTRCLEAVDEKGRPQQLALFPADRPVPGHAQGFGVQVRLEGMRLERPRQWGACWLFTEIWSQLQLVAFWQPRLPDSREGTSWYHTLVTSCAYRLIDLGSEWWLHRQWYGKSAMGDLLDEDFSLAAKDNLYRVLDQLVAHKADLCSHLQERWKDLFGASFDVLLYDLTSTYFESVTQGTDGLRRFGYSRDSRPKGDSQPQAARRANEVRQPQRLRAGRHLAHRHSGGLSPRLRSPVRQLLEQYAKIQSSYLRCAPIPLTSPPCGTSWRKSKGNMAKPGASG